MIPTRGCPTTYMKPKNAKGDIKYTLRVHGYGQNLTNQFVLLNFYLASKNGTRKIIFYERGQNTRLFVPLKYVSFLSLNSCIASSLTNPKCVTTLFEEECLQHKVCSDYEQTMTYKWRIQLRGFRFQTFK